MPAIPLGLSQYKRTELPPLPLKNWYYEKAPTNLEDQVALIPRPRLAQFTTVGLGPIRGIFRKGNVLANAGNSGKIICLSGTVLYRVDQTTGAATQIGTGITGDLRMSAEGDETRVVFALGQNAYYTDGNTVTTIAFPDGKFVYAVDFLSGYYVFSSELGRFYWSAPGGVTVAALDYATAESQPDVLMTLKVIGDELWLFGRYSIEVWQPTGDSALPFQRIGGRVFGIGVTGRMAVQKLSLDGVDSIAWVGTDGKIYRTNPNPVRISDHGMEERLKRVADPTQIYAVTDNWHGHDFYTVHIPGEGSFTYDFTTGVWHERTSFGRSLFRGAVSSLAPNNDPLLGDDTSNVIWRMTGDQVKDGSDPVLYECSGLLEVVGGPQRCNNVLLETAPGRAKTWDADPTVTLSWSDDMGDNFGDELSVPLGRQGERLATVAWTRLPQLRRPGRLFVFRTTEPVTVRKAKYNTSLRA